MLQNVKRSIGLVFFASLVIIPLTLSFKKSHKSVKSSANSRSPSADPSPRPTPPSAMATPPPGVDSRSHFNETQPSGDESRSPVFLFPEAHSTVIPDPSRFFSPHLLSDPLPTNSFFQNFVLKDGDQPEYIHPYLVQSSSSRLSLCYPARFANPSFTYQTFFADLTVSAVDDGADPDSRRNHTVSSFSDLGVTLDFPTSNLRFFLVRGSPFLTLTVFGDTALSVSTIHAFLSVSPAGSPASKHTIELNNEQKWLLYSSSPINLTFDKSRITSEPFTGTIRIAILPRSGQRDEAVLDAHSSRFPISGEAVLTKPFGLMYKWSTRGDGHLLMLAHPLHLDLLSAKNNKFTVLDDFRYKSIDGDLVGVVGDSWSLEVHPVSVSWHSFGGIDKKGFEEISSALSKDVDSLNAAATAATTSSSYFYGKLIARAARLALISEEVSSPEVIPAIRSFLKQMIEPWLDGTFGKNGFQYERKWGGLVTQQGSVDPGADFGFGIFNDHHYHLGYFLYAIAVLAKIDPAWGRMYKQQAYSLMADFMTLDRLQDSPYPRLRCFDLYKLHSWAGGLTGFADGRNQESTSEAVNAYHSAALMGVAYGDVHLATAGGTLAALEIQAAQRWWHVKEGGDLYLEDFTRNNRMVGVLWSTKRDSGLWFAPEQWRECRVGIQVLPLLPITEVLFSDVGFVKELVTWTLPALGREGVEEGWKGLVYALEGIYDPNSALEKMKKLTTHDSGNSLSNLLWWIYSRRG